jgi:SAM-dependent methyltransferase
VTASTTKGGSAAAQGRLWSARARDWVEVQEATLLPLFDAIADGLGIGAGTRALDVGCGAGRYLRRAADREAAAHLGALGALLPPPPRARRGRSRCRGPVRSRRGRAPAVDETDVEVVWAYPDERTLLRGLLSAGPAVRAIAEAGEARVRDAVLAAVAPYRTPGDAYRLRNVFRYAVAARQGG